MLLGIKNLWKRLVIILTWLFFLLLKLTKSKQHIDYNKILVLYISGFGDIICFTPFYEKLRVKFPEAEIWACFPDNVIALENSFFEFNDYINHESYLNTLKEIRRNKFDLVILPGWILKDSILALLSGSKEILGYINELTFSNRYLNKFLIQSTNPIKISKWLDTRECHLSERANLILDYLGIEPVQSEEISYTRRENPEDYSIIHAGARFPGRQWQPENYAEIADYLIDKKICKRVILIGGEHDAKINHQIIIKSKNNSIIDFSGRLNLIETKLLIEKAVLFVGNDSGPMHIAAFCGVPTIGLLGPNYPHISRPLGKNSDVVFHRFPCAGCNQRVCNNGYQCINSISISEVCESIENLLNAI